MIYHGQDIDVPELLDSWGLVGYVAAGNFNGMCPFHDSSSQNFSMSVKTGAWICFVGCHEGEGRKRNFEFFVECMGKSFADIEYVEADSVGHLLSLLNPPEEVEKTQIDTTAVVKDYLAQSETKFAKWVFERRLTRDLLKRWNCRYDSATRSLVIPIGDVDGSLLALCRRFSPSLAPRRYHYTSGFEASEHVFGLRQAMNEPIVGLCEGAIDAMYLTEAGLPSIAFFGSYISEKQIELVTRLHTTEVVLAFDNPKLDTVLPNGKIPGEEAAKRVVKELSGFFNMSRLDFGRAKDANDLEIEALQHSIEQRQPHLLARLRDNAWRQNASGYAPAFKQSSDEQRREQLNELLARARRSSRSN